MSGLAFEWTFRAGDILTLIGGLSVAATFLYRRGRMDSWLANTIQALTSQMAQMKNEITKLGDVIISQARFDEKLTAIDRRVTGHDQEISGLRRGWIQGEHGIDREYGRS